jgi:hypothetical protein
MHYSLCARFVSFLRKVGHPAIPRPLRFRCRMASAPGVVLALVALLRLGTPGRLHR